VRCRNFKSAALESGVARDVREAILLKAKGLVRSFGRFNAVDDVDLEVTPGTITGLIGPNGAGKSTLFNLIAGALPPTAGVIQFEGADITGLPPNRIFTLGLARTFQIPRPFPRMTVLENVMLVPLHQSGERFWSNWLAGRRVAREERAIRERAAEALGFCGLGQKLDEFAGNLSGGQQKLLELARVMMIDPKLILLDEPAAGVNPALIEILIDKILELKARGVTFLIIEHNMDLVMRICRPLIVMTQGRVIARGSPDEVRNDPRVLDAYLGEVTL
jgi:branched-chain amino acid transport system ATP-binding protein